MSSSSLLDRADDRGWGRRRVLLLVVSGLLLIGVAVGAVVLLTADDPDPAVARDTLATVEAPGPDWNAERQLVAGSSAQERYQVSWRVPVSPGEEQGRCDEAAAWLIDTGALMPGEPVFDGEDEPTASEVGDRCADAISTFEGAGSDVFATWPNTRDAGYQFGPYLMFRTDGDPGGSLLAAVEARQEG